MVNTILIYLSFLRCPVLNGISSKNTIVHLYVIKLCNNVTFMRFQCNHNCVDFKTPELGLRLGLG
jgi:hypothetical protein